MNIFTVPSWLFYLKSFSEIVCVAGGPSAQHSGELYHLPDCKTDLSSYFEVNQRFSHKGFDLTEGNTDGYANLLCFN